MRIKTRNILLGASLGCALLGGGIGIGFSIKANNEIAQVQEQIKNESEDSKIEQLKAKIAELANNEMIKSIVSYSTTLVGVAGFIVTLAKYRKYKSISSQEIAELTAKVSKEALEAKYEELETKLVNKLIEEFGNVEEALNIFEKIIILAQNKTTKGQAVLMEYLSSKVKSSEAISEDVKEAVEEVKESVNEEVEAEEEIKEEINKDIIPTE